MIRVVSPSLALALLLVGCGTMPSEGMEPMRPDAMAYTDARRICWEEGMGAPGGGQGESAAHQRLYENCMRRLGWAHKATMR